jgi:quercetin dioxygenase-like cupin family protein
MAYRVLPAADAFWRPSNQMGVLNTDLAKQLEAATLGARLWRLAPGQASTRHRHAGQDELYVLLEGRGRVRVEAELLTLDPLSALYVEADTVRQIFNDIGDDVLWLVVGAPPEAANTLEMTAEQLADLYPDGPRALPPELS